jgi:predicted O-methyltransferase YrrM
MNKDIIIFPKGDFSNKLISLMASIDLQLRTKKKVELIYSYSFNDLVFDNKKNDFMDQLPEFNFNNITYKYEKINLNIESYILSNLLITEHLSEYTNKVSKNEKLNIKKFGIEYNQYPHIDSGIIKNTWVQGFQNKGAPLVKKWLSDITKFKYYKTFMNEVGFDWYDESFEYVVIYLEISDLMIWIQNNTIMNKFILKPEWYDKALRILKSKINKPLKIIFYNNLRLNSKLLYKYLEVFNKYGIIINNLSKNIKSLQVEKLLIMSKVDDYIGPRHFIQVPSYLYSKKHSVTIINSHNTINYSYRKQDYPSNWVILDDTYYRIETNRDLQKYNLDILVGLLSTNEDELLMINKKSIKLTKNTIKSRYNSFYKNFNKSIKSKFLKDLLLYRYFELDKKVYYLNSNISINEGLFLFHLIKKYNPKKLLEIGLACGVSTSFMLISMDKKSKLTSVDPFQKYQWDSFGLNVVSEIINENKLTKNNHKWEPYFSHRFFSQNNNSYDLCFIDGDHSYKGTMIDLEGCHNLLKKDGLLVIDDVLHGPVKKALYDFLNNNSNMYKKIENDLKTMNGYIKVK